MSSGRFSTKNIGFFILVETIIEYLYMLKRIYLLSLFGVPIVDPHIYHLFYKKKKKKKKNTNRKNTKSLFASQYT